MNSTRKRNRKDKWLVFLLLFLSGDPAFYKQTWAPFGLIVICFLLLFIHRKKLNADFRKSVLIYTSVFLFIFIVQYFSLGTLPISFILGFFIKILIGAIIIKVLGERLSPVFLDVIYLICLISIPLYIIHLAVGENAFSGLYLDEGSHSIGIYTFRGKAPGEAYYRNSGMFWEPGGFQGYICLSLLLNFRRLPYLLKKQRFKLLVIFFAFLTTQSTTGFAVFALLVLMYLFIYTKINKFIAITMAALFVALFVFLFNSVDFLGTKVKNQFNQASSDNGDFNNTRFGAIILDYHYIQKNPLTGNGFAPETRYADDPEIIRMIEKGENPGLGNGFSDFIASAGILGMFWYFYVLYRNGRKASPTDAIVLIIILILLLQGEVLLRFPFFLGLPFLTPLFKVNRAPKVRRINHMLQQEG